MFTTVLYQALDPSLLPPSVTRNRVLPVGGVYSFELPFRITAPAVNPEPRLMTVLPIVIVYVPVETVLLINPLATAIDSIVSVLLTVIGPVYCVDEVVGVVPFVV